MSGYLESLQPCLISICAFAMERQGVLTIVMYVLMMYGRRQLDERARCRTGRWLGARVWSC